MLPKPKSLDIIAKDGKLRGKDESDNWWTIRWCGNGAYSHWVLIPDADPETGWYEFIYRGVEYEREKRSSLLEKQIRAAELKYKIYS
jgi:hypothetical protein